MLTDHRERLAHIRRFDQLVAYLRDELGWPIDSDDFEELTFEYTPEELGIDTKNAAKIQEIKRLRPLVPGQPWGIFFVKFEPKRLPVLALRRILGQVALKKRTSANKSERQAWAADDLLFVSNYGEGEERRIAFAHFSKPQDGHDLPTLQVLGWDNLDTPLHLDAVANKLTTHLAWPDDEGDPDAWSKRWRAAFKLRHREVIDLIHNTMAAKWKSQGHGEKKILTLWNEYVPKHLLPRLHGYELLMAPYAVAHLKIGLKLFETGYRFESDERARVYLTNALEPAGDEQLMLDFLPALAHEAQAVNEIKRKQRFTVVVGNPPYLGEAGRGGDWISGLMRGRESQSGRKTLSYFEVEGDSLNERNPKWLNDLYVRFTRLSHWLLEQTGLGLHGFITNHGCIDNPTFRGMRWALLASFDHIFVLDLHGNLKKKEVTPDGGKDENVFDIEQGVSIALFVKMSPRAHEVSSAHVRHTECWGARAAKYDWLLARDAAITGWVDVEPRPAFYLFKPFGSAGTENYDKWPSVTDIFPINSVGIVTARDALTVQWSAEEIWRVVSDVAQRDTEEVRSKYRLGKDVRDWRVVWAQDDLQRSGPSNTNIVPILYRPFDTRFTYYTGNSRGFICMPRQQVTRHMLAGENVGLIFMRQVAMGDTYTHFGASRHPVDNRAFYSNKGIMSFGPLYLYPGVGKTDGALFSRWAKGKDGRTPNLDSGFVEQIAAATELRFVSDGRGDLRETLGPEDVLAWIYAVFHSPRYRERYEAQLKLDFPRVPLPRSAELFRRLAEVGHDLLALHLLESPKLDKSITSYAGPKIPEVGRVGWSNGTVWLDASKTNAHQGHRATRTGTIGFQSVPEEVWDFHIGGYQVCHKWLKDRKGRALLDEDLAHYQKIVVALNETIRIMDEIDEVIEAHGGWPDTFHTGSEADEARRGAS